MALVEYAVLIVPRWNRKYQWSPYIHKCPSHGALHVPPALLGTDSAIRVFTGYYHTQTPFGDRSFIKLHQHFRCRHLSELQAICFICCQSELWLQSVKTPSPMSLYSAAFSKTLLQATPKLWTVGSKCLWSCGCECLKRQKKKIVLWKVLISCTSLLHVFCAWYYFFFTIFLQGVGWNCPET